MLKEVAAILPKGYECWWPDVIAKQIKEYAENTYKALMSPTSRTHEIVLLFPYKDEAEKSTLVVPENHITTKPIFRTGIVLHNPELASVDKCSHTGSHIVQINPYHVVPILGDENLVAVEPRCVVCYWTVKEIAEALKKAAI